MRNAINKKRIVLYAVCAFFFCLAGVFQAVDSSLPVFWHALFALLAHTILISLVVARGVCGYGAHDTEVSRGGVGRFSYT